MREVVEGLKALIKNPDITIPELMKYIPAPDFPTGERHDSAFKFHVIIAVYSIRIIASSNNFAASCHRRGNYCE